MNKYNAITLFLCLVISTVARADARDQAKRIHDRLTGVPPSAAMLDAMTTSIGNGAGGVSIAAMCK